MNHYDLILIAEQKDTAKTRINSLLNLPPESELGTPLNLRHRTFKYSVKELYPLKEKDEDLARLSISKTGKKLAQIKYPYKSKLAFSRSDSGWIWTI